MVEIIVYTFEDEDGTTNDYSTMDSIVAHEWGRRFHQRVIANSYVWDDYATEWDFRRPQVVQDEKKARKEWEHG
jgi:hypothetical protein